MVSERSLEIKQRLQEIHQQKKELELKKDKSLQRLEQIKSEI